MYKVKTAMDINGVGWGLDFNHGVAFTDREDLARRLKSLGYEVEDMTKAPAKQSATASAVETAEAQATTLGDAAAPDPTPETKTLGEGDTTPSAAPASQSAGQDANPPGAEKLKCPICGKECGSQAVLTRHKNKEHG